MPNADGLPVYFAQYEGRWIMYLVLPRNRLRKYEMTIASIANDEPLLDSATLYFTNPPGLPTQHSQGPLSVIVSSGAPPAPHTPPQPVEAAYLIAEGVRRVLTVDFFESRILSEQSTHKLSTLSCGGMERTVQWCVAVLDALEVEGTVAKGETMLFVLWLRGRSEELAQTPDRPQIKLPEGFDDFVKDLDSVQASARLDLRNREISGTMARRNSEAKKDC